ncbi:MAG: hypothetical protein ACE37F_04120 [Nannocystaceae bacterium]|nr:hypothetical protein [bacterium]
MRRIEQAVGMSFHDRVDVFLYEVDQRCANSTLPIESDGAAGCALDGQAIAADAGSLSHELVHALRLQNGIRGNPFFEEGIARAVGNGYPSNGWTVSRMDFSPSSLSNAAVEQWSEYSVDTSRFGAHFTSWALEDEEVAAQLLRFLASDYTGDVEASFRDAFGADFQSVEANWERSSEDAYFASGRCDGLAVHDLAEGPLRVEGKVSCEDPYTEGNEGVLYLAGRACFRLPAAAQIRISAEAEAGLLSLLPLDCSDAGRSVFAGETQETAISGCTWSAAMTTQGEDIDAFSYQIELLSM